MSVEVDFVEPTLELINDIAEDMRQQDAEEVWHAGRHTPIEALVKGWEQSEYSAIVTVDREPCVMLGLVSRDVLSGAAMVWLLGTNAALKHRRCFMSYGRSVLNNMLDLYPTLYNYVYSGNTVSMRWLKALGFKLDKGEPYGLDHKTFHKFHIERVA